VLLVLFFFSLFLNLICLFPAVFSTPTFNFVFWWQCWQRGGPELGLEKLVARIRLPLAGHAKEVDPDRSLQPPWSEGQVARISALSDWSDDAVAIGHN